MTIPLEAIEAAAQALEIADHDGDHITDGFTLAGYIRRARGALEAALPFLLPQPSEDEVERMAKAIYACCERYPRYALSQMNNHLADSFARAAIAAMNRAPQRTYEDGLRRAAEIVNHWGGEQLEVFTKEILAELGHPPQPPCDDTIECEVCHVRSQAPVAPACYGEKCPRRLQHDGPSREELLAALKQVDHEATDNKGQLYLSTVLKIRALIAQADNAGKPEGEGR